MSCFLAHAWLLSHFVIARNRAGKSLVHNLVQPELRHIQILAIRQQCLWLSNMQLPMTVHFRVYFVMLCFSLLPGLK